MSKRRKNNHIFDDIAGIFSKLRGENGCPWDKVQTIKTLKKDIMSEVREAIYAINKNDISNLKEELGDVMWSIFLISQISAEKKHFDIYDVLKELKKKVIRRHPHVFGRKKAKNAKEALKIFNQVKLLEKLNKIKNKKH